MAPVAQIGRGSPIGAPRIHPAAQIHPHACVNDNVTIGARTTVWQFASVIRHAHIGADCTVATSALIDGATIGNRCKIQHCAAVGPGIILHNDVFVGPFAMFCNDTWPSIDKDGFDMDALLSGEWTVVVRDGASIGAHATILPGVTIGAGATIAAGVVVRCDVPDRHLFGPDGLIVPLDPDRPRKRMKFASC